MLHEWRDWLESPVTAGVLLAILALVLAVMDT